MDPIIALILILLVYLFTGFIIASIFTVGGCVRDKGNFFAVVLLWPVVTFFMVVNDISLCLFSSLGTFLDWWMDKISPRKKKESD